MKFDDASWHYGGDFPAGLRKEAAGTHAGVFLAWAILNGLGSDQHSAGPQSTKLQLEKRLLSPSQLLFQICDEKLIDEDFNDEGVAFAKAYYDLSNGSYLTDYEATLGADVPSLYHVPDTWETYSKLKPVLDRRLAEWRENS